MSLAKELSDLSIAIVTIAKHLVLQCAVLSDSGQVTFDMNTKNIETMATVITCNTKSNRSSNSRSSNADRINYKKWNDNKNNSCCVSMATTRILATISLHFS